MASGSEYIGIAYEFSTLYSLMGHGIPFALVTDNIDFLNEGVSIMETLFIDEG